MNREDCIAKVQELESDLNKQKKSLFKTTAKKEEVDKFLQEQPMELVHKLVGMVELLYLQRLGARK